MKLYFVRHGESEANVLRIISNCNFLHRLTATGRRQAQELAQRLQPCNITQIFASPILRAVETATIIGQQLDLSTQTVDALREYDCGVLEGRGDAESWRLHAAYAQAWLKDRDWSSKPEQGESFLDIRQRFVPFIQQLVAQYSHSSEHILLVGHGGLYRLMLPLLLPNIDDAFISIHGIGHTCCIEVEAGSAGWFVCAGTISQCQRVAEQGRCYSLLGLMTTTYRTTPCAVIGFYNGIGEIFLSCHGPQLEALHPICPKGGTQ